MARSSEPNSATSEFFINTVDNHNLDYPSFDGYGYTVFGEVKVGLDIIEKIEVMTTGTLESPYVPVPMENWPIEPIEIIKAYLKEE